MQKETVESGCRSFLAFEVAGKSYGVLTSRVREVIPPVPITPAPDVPRHILGVISLRHEIIPVVDLARLLCPTEETTIGAASCFVIVLIRSSRGALEPIGIVTHCVQDSFRPALDRFDAAPSIASRPQAAYVQGFARTEKGVKTLLDVDKLFAPSGALLDQAVSSGAAVEESPDGGPAGEGAAKAPGDAARIKLLSVILGESEYAFPVSEIRKTIPADDIEPDRLAPDVLTGSMKLGRERLGVVDLRAHLGLTGKTEHTKRSTIVIGDHDGVMIGYLVDDLGALYDVGADQLQHSGSLDGLTPARSYGLGFVEINGRTLEVLSFQRLIPPETVSAIANWKTTKERVEALDEVACGAVAEKETRVDPALEALAGTYVVVRVGSQLMGIEADVAEEVLPWETLLAVADAKHDFAGMLLLRDQNYPVMDLRLHFDLPDDSDGAHRPAIVLVRSGQARVGLAVQEVRQLAKIAPIQVRPKSDLTIDVHEHLIRGGAELPIGNVVLLDIPAVLADDEPSMLRSWKEFQDNAPASGKRNPTDQLCTT